MKKKVVIGMSGGVDSAVAAYLLKEQGYDVTGVAIQMLPCEMKEAGDAMKAADRIGIPFNILEFHDEFEKEVIDTFTGEYMRGRTPNPCCECNSKIKWNGLIRRADELGAEYVATGHYARIDRLKNGRYAICSPASSQKDQTYVLCRLTQEQLARTVMPLGGYLKDRVREIARDIGIEVALKPDSQDICFVEDGDYAGFIKDRTGTDNACGNFVDMNGNVLGTHKGIYGYTIGQRKGLGLSMGKPVFVNEIRTETGEVVVGDEDIIFKTELEAENINYMGAECINVNDRFCARIRYAHKGAMCTVSYIDDRVVRLKFDSPVRAVTPGQSVVLYDGDYVMAGAVIVKAL